VFYLKDIVNLIYYYHNMFTFLQKIVLFNIIIIMQTFLKFFIYLIF